MDDMDMDMETPIQKFNNDARSTRHPGTIVHVACPCMLDALPLQLHRGRSTFALLAPPGPADLSLCSTHQPNLCGRNTTNDVFVCLCCQINVANGRE